MENTEAKRHVHPAILAWAKELRRPLTPQENELWQRLRENNSTASSSGGSIRFILGRLWLVIE